MYGEWTDAKLEKYRRMYASLRRFYTFRQARWWLSTPHDVFGDRSAISMIHSGRADEVWAEIDRLARSEVSR